MFSTQRRGWCRWISSRRTVLSMPQRNRSDCVTRANLSFLCPATKCVCPNPTRYHIAVTYTGGTYVLYLNGVALRTVTGVNTPASLTGSPTSAWLGTNSGSNVFEGRLRDVRVYSRALS